VTSLLGEASFFAAAKAFYIDSIRRLEEELATFKEEHQELPWHRV
jgi:hypothetical protein